ncbi:MAG: LysR family transcriptional regulator [Verrucomicrobiales bacterium]|nr:LysR family transcriptional regulator [Verrucomicrobiales bacterium]
MELHQLRYFVAVADEGNFSRAAAREHVAQPSLSQQIQKLEFEVGQPLFDRLPRGAVLTQAGEKLLVHAKRVLSEIADARNALSLRGDLAGTVRLGIIPTIAPFFLPRLLAGLSTRHPRIALDTIEDVTSGLLRRLEIGDLDLALVSTTLPSVALRIETVATENLVVLVHARSPLALKPSLQWQHLNTERFLVLQDLHCLSSQVAQVCAKHRVHPNTVFQGAQLETIARLVTAGLGLSLVPAMMAVGDRDPERTYLPLRSPQPTRPLNIAWNPHRHRHPRALAVAKAIATELASLGSGLAPAIPSDT